MDGKMSLERRKDGSMMGMNDEFRTEGGKEGQEALCELKGRKGRRTGKKHCMTGGELIN